MFRARSRPFLICAAFFSARTSRFKVSSLLHWRSFWTLSRISMSFFCSLFIVKIIYAQAITRVAKNNGTMIPTIAAMAKVKILLCRCRRWIRALQGSALISLWLVHLFDLSFFIFILVSFVSSLTLNTVSISHSVGQLPSYP